MPKNQPFFLSDKGALELVEGRELEVEIVLDPDHRHRRLLLLNRAAPLHPLKPVPLKPAALHPPLQPLAQLLQQALLLKHPLQQPRHLDRHLLHRQLNRLKQSQQLPVR